MQNQTVWKINPTSDVLSDKFRMEFCFDCRPSQRWHHWLDLQQGSEVLLHLWVEGHRSLRLPAARQSDHSHCPGDLAGSDGHHGPHSQESILMCFCVDTWSLRNPYQLLWGVISKSMKRNKSPSGKKNVLLFFMVLVIGCCPSFINKCLQFDLWHQGGFWTVIQRRSAITWLKHFVLYNWYTILNKNINRCKPSCASV